MHPNPNSVDLLLLKDFSLFQSIYQNPNSEDLLLLKTYSNQYLKEIIRKFEKLKLGKPFLMDML